MKKIKLNINQLKVTSFEITEKKSKLGTIKGNRPPETEDWYCLTEDPNKHCLSEEMLVCETIRHTCRTCPGHTYHHNCTENPCYPV